MSGDFSIDGVNSQLGVHLEEEKDALGDMTKNYDADDPMAAFNLEMAASKYKAEMSMMAALVKDLSDVQQQIIQKV